MVNPLRQEPVRLSPGRLNIGLLVMDINQQNLLTHLVMESGHRVAVSLRVEEFGSSPFEADLVDAWLVLLPTDDDGISDTSADLERWLEQLTVPVIIDDCCHTSPADVEYPAWCRRVRQKLQGLQGAINLAHCDGVAAERLWVLAGSTGGPEAVRAFFQALPGQLDVGFIYVQHINTGYEQSLLDMVNRHSDYPAYPLSNGDVLRVQSTAVLAVDQQVELQSNGTVVIKDEPWPGDYSPSVDQVFANLARSFGPRCGVIVFSGMGDDGAVGVRLVHQQGGQVWAQSPQTCTVASMPEAAIATGAVSLVASPEQLARQLGEYLAAME